MQPPNDSSSQRRPRALILVRHGESERNADGIEREADSDSPLTDRGRGQASALARWMTQQFESRAISLRSSPSRRCLETAETVARRLRSAVVVDEDLREPAAKEPTMVASAEEAQAMLDAVTSGGARPPRTPTETHAALVARLRGALDRALGESADTVVLVSHFVTLNVLLRLLIEPDSPRAGMWVRLDNASVTRVEVDGSGGVMLGFVNRVV